METVCTVCMHQCSLKLGQRGICRARKNEGGKIICENYGQVTSLALDPIEKKPLGMFRQGSLILSVGSYGCNLRCPFCQNHEISMAFKRNDNADEGSVKEHCMETSQTVEAVFVPPQALAEEALKYAQRAEGPRPSRYGGMGNIGVAFTYNEPLVGWEYVRDTAKLVKEMGMVNVLVTNGTASREVLEEILPYVDAMNIDLKAFREETYRKYGGDLETVKEFIVRAAASCHVELTTLIVPGENDSAKEMEEEARWIASVEKSAGKKLPLHVTRFFPRYRMRDREATEIHQVYELAQKAREYLPYVFVGNC